MRISTPTGKEDTYHYTGTIQGANFQVSHHSGHSFRGRLTNDGRIVGELHTKEGRSFPIEFPVSSFANPVADKSRTR
jgi:hypothetical protein